MAIESQDYDEDELLTEALETLKALPQATVAYEIGISERRFRDIERGRSRPRFRTREAILRLADDLRAGILNNGESSPWARVRSASAQTAPNASNTAEVLYEGQASPIPAIVVGVLLLVGIAATIWFGHRSEDG
jgi:DNA-binding XRE family transcriptional regulator